MTRRRRGSFAGRIPGAMWMTASASAGPRVFGPDGDGVATGDPSTVRVAVARGPTLFIPCRGQPYPMP